MTEADIYWTFATAYQHGGGFFQALAHAGLKADPGNMHRQLRSGAAA
jgi:hypothetical protein